MLRDHPDVARDRELHARAECCPVDRRDHRRGVADDRVEQELERRPERVTTPVLEPACGVSGATAEVRSGTERLVAGAADDHRTEVGLRCQPLGELVAEVGAEGVAALRPVEERDADVARPFPEDAHVRTRRSAR